MITIIDTGKVGSAAGFYIQLKSATIYAPGAVIAMMADAVLKGRNRVMSISTRPEAIYSCSAVSIGVRVILGKNGVERII